MDEKKEKFLIFCIITIVVSFFVTLIVFCKISAPQAGSSSDLVTGEETKEKSSYRLTLSAEPSVAGTVSGGGNYTDGDTVTLSATTANGYEFIGWFDGETVVGETITYRFPMPSENKSYVARWRVCTYKVTAISDPAEGGSVSGGGSYAFGSEVTLVAAPVSGFGFVGWYEGDKKIEEETDLTYSFVLPAQSRSVTAKYECIFTRLEERSLLFGSYPQSEVKEESVVNALNARAGDLPTVDHSGSWTSYDYYTDGSNETDFMWYKDLSFDGEKYRGVYFTAYRKRKTNDPGSGNAQSGNGYSVGTVYWFRFEPIKWRILSEHEGKVFVFCDGMIDSREFNALGGDSEFEHNGGVGYANNYALSDIRKWLNQTFYQTAFSDFQKAFIVRSTVDNSAKSANPNDFPNRFFGGDNVYAGGEVEDFVFLLSVQEVTNSDYGFSNAWSTTDPARHLNGTDYSKAQGLDQALNSWWLRSPFSKQPQDAFCQHNDVLSDRDYVFLTYFGISPALVIRI